jgi:hypothetical protein
MNDLDLAMSAQLFRAFTGLATEGPDFQRLVGSSICFEEFRIRLALDTTLAGGDQTIAGVWRKVVRAEGGTRRLGDMLHQIEQLAIKQAQIERNVDEQSGKLLDLLRQMDTLTENVARAHREAEEVRRLLGRYRQAMIRLGEQMEADKEISRA